jgi:Fe2+ transport system protein B
MVKINSQIKLNQMKTLTKVIASKLSIGLFFLFMVFSMTLMSSCVATVRTPHHHRSSSTVIISEGGHHDNGNHYGQYKNKNKNKN